MELLGVMAIISILAAVATPGFVSMMRDRRTAQETGMYTDAFRVARARALGRGAAIRVDVRESTATSAGIIVVAEHLDGTVTDGIPDVGTLPLPGCNGVDNWRTIATFVGRPNATDLKAFDHLGNARARMFVCYTPRGQTMVDYTGGGTTFRALQGVAYLEAKREAEAGATPRRVLILPNGLTRMAL